MRLGPVAPRLLAPRRLAVAAAVLVTAAAAVVLARDEPPEAVAAAEPVTTTTVPTTTTTTLPPTTTTAPPTTTTAPPAPPARDLTVYSGLGTWIDVYDWSVSFNRGDGRVEIGDIDRMADAGVQTLYVQTSKWDSPSHVLEPERLLPMIARAKTRGMEVVGWYLPTFTDPAADMHRLMEISRLPGIDGLVVDIESLKLPDVQERNRRLVEISTNLRAALPGVPIGAAVYPPVVTDVINPDLWPDFPWGALAPLYDVWLPMSYQSDRKPESGYRDGYRYTAENIDRLRSRVGAPVPIHTIGGIADRTSTDDLAGILRAAGERRVLGGSLYDWRTTRPELWSLLAGFRNPARG